MTLELLEMPVRAKGEGTYDYIMRRDSVRINNLEFKLETLTQQVKRLQNEKRPRK